MTQSIDSKQLGLVGLLLVGALVASGEPAIAQQIVPDNTLGGESSTVTPDVIKGIESDRIDGGARRGANLFHSFRDFNVGEGRGAYFANPAGIENILGRVTGANASNILGTLGVLGNANLFLINPNGIIFGPNARLDVGGSFVGTTANAIAFGNQGFFNATKPNSPPLLIISPSAFLFNQIAAAPIQGNSGGFRESDSNTFERLYDEGLRVPNHRSLVLLGGNITFNRGSLAAPGGRIELAGVAGAGAVGLTDNSGSLRLNVPNSVSRADISLNQFLADVVAGEGGNIRVTARNLDILDNSELRAGIGEGLGSVNAKAGDITLNATRAVTIVDSVIINELGNTRLANIDLPTLGAVGQGGNIKIQANSLFLGDIDDTFFTETGQLITGTTGQGDAGDIFIRTNESISLDFAEIASTVESEAVGQGGNIDIQAGAISLNYFSSLLTSARGQGDSGNILVRVNDFVVVKGSNITTDVLSEAVGQGGDIDIEAEAGSIIFTGGTSISASTFGRGDAGDVFIRANDSVLIEGSFIQTRAESLTAIPEMTPGFRAIGDGGDIAIQAESLSLTDSLPGGFPAVLSTSTNADGNAGNLIVRVDNSIFVRNSIVSSAVEPEGRGQGGDITFTTESLSLSGGYINTGTLGRGQGGDIRVNASNFVNLSGVDLYGYTSELATSTGRGATGQAGDIVVNTNNFRLLDGAVVNARTLNSRDGGSITINANTFEAVDGGQVVTTSLSSGNAGSITVNIADNITLTGSDPTYSERLAEFGENNISNAGPASGLFANTAPDSSGDGGSIFIDPQTVVVRDGASIAVNSQGTGAGGSITLQAGSLNLDNATISAETTSNTGGNISLAVQDILFMLRNSQITASAGTERLGGNGGNIDINAQFLAATENSRITADAFEGNGGNINIDTSSIFGLAESDITASSELGLEGTVEIDTPEVDPSRGLVELPTTPVATEVVQACALGDADEQSEFVITGRGGLPPSPDEALRSDAIEVGWVSFDPSAADHNSETQSVETRSQEVAESSDSSTVPDQIVEAQGLAVDNNGEIWFVASAPTAPPGSSWQSSTSCHADENY